jgi:hypothetical protein
MKKNIFARLVLLVTFIGLTCAVFGVNAALDVPTAQPIGAPPAQLQTTDVITTINSLTNWFFALFLIVAVWFLILAAFHFVTANGETEKVNTARNEVMYAMIGVLIAVLAKGIVALAMGLAVNK